MRQLLVFTFLLATAGCSSSSDTGTSGDGAVDADHADGAGCPDPAAVIGGGVCTGNASCSTDERCIACGHNSYEKTTLRCDCNGTNWACPIHDCGPSAPGTYSDASCTTLNPGPPDASPDGADADETSDASDGG